MNSRALAVLRIGVGALFLIFGEYKVFGTQFTLHGGFQYWINRFLEGGAYPLMAPVLRGFVLGHATPIAFLVAYGELAIGIAPFRNSGAGRELRRAGFHAHVAFFFRLSRCGRAVLAIFWREPESFGLHTVFCCVLDWPRRCRLVPQSTPQRDMATRMTKALGGHEAQRQHDVRINGT